MGVYSSSTYINYVYNEENSMDTRPIRTLPTAW